MGDSYHTSSSWNLELPSIGTSRKASGALVASVPKTFKQKTFKNLGLLYRGTVEHDEYVGHITFFLLKVAALEVMRRVSRVYCPLVWRSLQALQTLCYPPFKWIQRWTPFKELVLGMQVDLWKSTLLHLKYIGDFSFSSRKNNFKIHSDNDTRSCNEVEDVEKDAVVPNQQNQPIDAVKKQQQMDMQRKWLSRGLEAYKFSLMERIDVTNLTYTKIKIKAPKLWKLKGYASIVPLESNSVNKALIGKWLLIFGFEDQDLRRRVIIYRFGDNEFWWSSNEGVKSYGYGKLSRPLLFLSVATALSEHLEDCKEISDAIDDSQSCSEPDLEQIDVLPTQDSGVSFEPPQRSVSVSWLLQLYEELEHQNITLPERIDEDELRRFYASANGDFSCLLSSIKNTIHWRQSYNILSAEELKIWSHLVFWHGCDVKLRPCLFIRLGLACTSLASKDKSHFAQAIEDVVVVAGFVWDWPVAMGCGRALVTVDRLLDKASKPSKPVTKKADSEKKVTKKKTTEKAKTLAVTAPKAKAVKNVETPKKAVAKKVVSAKKLKKIAAVVKPKQPKSIKSSVAKKARKSAS
ncbi:hypothetical protein GIB67_029489 [Kingdonia uniflora]|uniref:Uncharacterized protein n=1 Tax=Kingdonia uniflora TaxID=39325 RepID=A0A7J7NXY4_9MAGN|nr:hypothetical protein GIB67_029489 [Kingdonia uniflora]